MRTNATIGALLGWWLPRHELDATTRMNYESQTRNCVKLALEDAPLMLLLHNPSERLAGFMPTCGGAGSDAAAGRPSRSTRWKAGTTGSSRAVAGTGVNCTQPPVCARLDAILSGAFCCSTLEPDSDTCRPTAAEAAAEADPAVVNGHGTPIGGRVALGDVVGL